MSTATHEGWKKSLIAHGSLIVIILLKCLVFPNQTQTYIPTLKVDLVGLPDVLKKDLAHLKNPAHDRFKEEISKALKKVELDAKRIQAEAKDVVKSNEMIIKTKPTPNTEKKNQDALKRLKALDRIQNLAEDPTNQAHPQLVKGNQVSKGSSLSGEAKEASLSNYNDLLQDKIKENWNLPVWLDRQKLAAQVQIYINSEGRLTHSSFQQSSGNAQFDAEVLKTLQLSQPFPIPPEDLKRTVLEDGILLGFPL